MHCLPFPKPFTVTSTLEAPDFHVLHIAAAEEVTYHLCPQPVGESLIISRSLSTLQLFQISPPNRTTLASVNFTIPLHLLLAAYIAIISPEQTMNIFWAFPYSLS
jgi:hypothetical protein